MKRATFNVTHRLAVFLGCAVGGLVVASCASANEDDGDVRVPNDEATTSGDAEDGDAGEASPSASTTPALTSEFEPLDPLPGEDEGSADAGNGEGEACASTSAAAQLQELALAFAFDVSGSMGEGDLPYHNKELKWDPVVAATEAFFESSDVARVAASMVFFPKQEENRCDAELYATPDVPLQELPSDAFGDAIGEIFPDRGGTPTLAVLQATIAYVDGLIDAGSTARHAIVLVTDGMPQGCSEETDSIEAVAIAVSEVSSRIPVYVVGIANPPTEEEPNPPDNVTSLHQIAAAGGTSTAFLIDTGNPTQTASDFEAAIEEIRASSLSCYLAIPDAPAGKTFDKEKVNVTMTAEGDVSLLIYSEDCTEPAAWRYDDPANPSQIELCEATCQEIETYADVSVQVEFGCERRMASVK
jgi:von Willebrand factor type A domain